MQTKLSIADYDGKMSVRFSHSYRYNLYLLTRWFAQPVIYGLLIDTSAPEDIVKQVASDLKEHQRTRYATWGIVTPRIDNVTSKLSNYLTPSPIHNTIEYANTMLFVGDIISREYLPPGFDPVTGKYPQTWDYYDKTYYVKSNGQHGVADYATGDVPSFFNHISSLNL